MYTADEVRRATLDYFRGDTFQTDVFVDKYALRDKKGNYYELTPDDMHHRLAREFARIEQKYPGPLREQTIYEQLKDFGYVVPQGSPMFGIGNDFQLVSTSNCSLIGSPEDSMSSIFDTARDMANLYKRRFGVGVNISTLRPDGASVNNAAMTSTGAWSFADFYSYVTRMVGQAGRRGALMICMDCRHPDVLQFVTMKNDLTKVTGANVSVLVSDDFMQAVREDTDWRLYWPVDCPDQPKFEKTIRARELFDTITRSACQTGEPGFLFWDTITRNLPLGLYSGFETIGTNPCGEIPLSAYDSCRLISIYLANFVVNPFRPNAYFDFDRFRFVIGIAMRLSDDLIDLEIEKLEQIRDAADTADEKELFKKFIRAAQDGRRTGLGTHGLADTLARLRVKYGSDLALGWVGDVYRELRDNAYQESIFLAEERGAFPAFDWEVERDCDFIRRLPKDLQYRLAVSGRRNGAILTGAPTGSVSALSDNCSSGIEPVFALNYKRRRKVERNNPSATLVDPSGDAWVEYTVNHKNVDLYRSVFPDGELPDYFVTAAEINWRERVVTQATIQQYVDHSLSSTINLPEAATPETVGEIYMLAWKEGCKGITVYRDGSRPAQVLTVQTEAKPEQDQMEMILDRVDDMLSEKATPYLIAHRPLETLGGMRKATFVDSLGRERKVYCYVGKNDDDELVETFLTDEFGGPEVHAYAAALGRLVSLSLKYSIPVDEIADKLIGLRGDSHSFSGGSFCSVPDFLGKRLLDWQARLQSANETAFPIEVPVVVRATAVAGGCPNCGSALNYEGSCPQCKTCGWSKC
jgi:ribonucleoside-diphosphate reductase alpha chain